jgi:hypothetical protein
VTEIGFKNLSLFCKIGVVGGVVTLAFYVMAFLVGFVIGVTSG